MRSDRMLLLRTLRRASGGAHILRHERDRKKRAAAAGRAVGQGILFLLLAVYAAAVAAGCGMAGLAASLPLLCAVTVSALMLPLALFQSNARLFAFRDYDLLMSLPLTVRTVVSAKFCDMALALLPWTLCLSLPMGAGYVWFARPGAASAALWLLLTPFLPLVPMVAASALGALVAAMGTLFRHKQLAQSVLIFALVLGGFALRIGLEALFRSGAALDALRTMAEAMEQAGAAFPTAVWFARAVERPGVTALALPLASLLALEGFLALLSRFYRPLNARLTAGASRGTYRLGALRPRRPVQSVAWKEFRRFTGSSLYLTNTATGMLLTLLLCAAALVFDMDRVLAVITQGAPVGKRMLLPAVPFLVECLTGMLPTTACSPSLEGRNAWIPQSLPLESRTLRLGKMLFNLYLTLPFVVVGNLCLGAACGASAGELCLFVLCGAALCAGSTVWGLTCGLRYQRLDWENEVEVIKQGAAVSVCVFPHLLLMMGLIVGAVILGGRLSVSLIAAAGAGAAALPALLTARALLRRET